MDAPQGRSARIGAVCCCVSRYIRPCAARCLRRKSCTRGMTARGSQSTKLRDRRRAPRNT
eukprot:3485877-Pleurochrysis_carterae.AAC.4